MRALMWAARMGSMPSVVEVSVDMGEIPGAVTWNLSWLTEIAACEVVPGWLLIRWFIAQRLSFQRFYGGRVQ